MAGIFEAGPWDSAKSRKGGVHAFSSDRKLLYGNAHDNADHLADDDDKANYGKAEKHKMHDFWRKNALKMLADQLKRGDHTLRKIAGPRGGPSKEVWPGDLGKHHRISEELIELGVITLHTDNNAVAYAKIQAAALHRAIERFAAEAEAAKQQQAAEAAAASATQQQQQPAFVAAERFAGKRAGRVFKMGDSGLGYYRDGPADEAEASSSRAAAAAPSSLPPGWVQGTSPEGYTYYWHTPTSTSSWEVPTGEPKSAKTMSLSAHVAHSLANDRGVAVRKIEEQCGASIRIDKERCTATAHGTAAEVARALQLIERKAGGLEYAAQASAQQQRVAVNTQQQQAAGQKRSHEEGSWDFGGVAGIVQEGEAARAKLQKEAVVQPGGALAALAQYGDDSDEDDE